MSDGKVIENVELVEIRPGDGAQLYRYGSAPTDCTWLMGINRATNVKIGDRGRLVYRSTASSGLYWFEKDGAA